MGLLTNTRKLLITAINDGWHFLLHINCGEMLLFGARLSQHWFGAASFKPHYRDDRCVSVCVCVFVVYKVFNKEVKWKSNNTETEQKVSTSKPFSVWMRLSSGAGMSSLSFLPNSISLHLFKYLLAEPASLSPPWYPGRLPSPHSHASSPPPAASLAGLKS